MPTSPTPFIRRLGEVLRDARHAAGDVTQDEVAAFVKCSRQTYNEYETGRSVMKLDRLEAVAQRLNTTVTALVEAAETGVIRMKEREIP